MHDKRNGSGFVAVLLSQVPKEILCHVEIVLVVMTICPVLAFRFLFGEFRFSWSLPGIPFMQANQEVDKRSKYIHSNETYT